MTPSPRADGAQTPGPRLHPPGRLRSSVSGQVSAGRAHNDPSHRLAKGLRTLPRKGLIPNPSPGPRPLPADRSGPPTGRAHDDSSSRPTCNRFSPSGLTGSPGPTGPRRPAPSALVRLWLLLLSRFTRILDRELVSLPPSRRPSQQSPRRLKGEAATSAASEGAKHVPAGQLAALKGPHGPGRLRGGANPDRTQKGRGWTRPSDQSFLVWGVQSRDPHD
ncbi:WW domain-binding protein 11-like [Rattus norvegicus]|uniref:WW domain-binding protein 11-like n=1 Tax=Rattus norvegicus TaxID=10116 RepID=UPI002FD82EE6